MKIENKEEKQKNENKSIPKGLQYFGIALVVLIVILYCFGEMPHFWGASMKILGSLEERNSQLTVTIESENKDDQFKSVYSKMIKDDKTSRYLKNTTKDSSDIYVISGNNKVHVDEKNETISKINENTLEKNSMFYDLIDLVNTGMAWGNMSYEKFENDKFGKTKITRVGNNYKVESEKLGNFNIEVKTEADEKVFKVNTNKLTEIQER